MNNDRLEGKATQLAAVLQQRYGLAHDDAERQAREFQDRHDWH